MPRRLLELSIVIAAPPARVWAVMTDPALSPRWLGGFRVVTDGRVGGPYALEGTLEGRSYREDGVLLAREPGALLRYSHWSPLWRLPDAPEHHAVLTLRLVADGAGTRVELTHEVPEALALAEHAAFFWRGALFQLRRLVEGGPLPG